MILTPHMLLGAAIASKIGYAPLAIILAFLSHYLLDIVPHIEYPIKNIQNKWWAKSLPDFLRVALDFSAGILIIYFFSGWQIIIFAGALFSVLPDAFNLLNYVFPNNFLKNHSNFHEKIHFLKNKKISVFWRIASQVLVAVVSVAILKI
jgi:hypothetical protein